MVCLLVSIYDIGSDQLGLYRKKDRTTALVVSAVLHGFRAIDTGSCHKCAFRDSQLKRE